jgi:ubiquinone/menaquinone biosynthesis C-methylase UbiE
MIPMTADVHREIYRGLDRVSAGRLNLIRKAFHMLPSLDRPRILDIGCGRGGPTIELARLSGGKVIGIDIDADALDELMSRAKDENLSGQIRVINCSMSNLSLEDSSIDVIWAEASIHIIGFEEGLDAWWRFLASNGCMVIHEMAWLHPDPPAEITDHWREVYPGIRTLPEYIAEVLRHGYNILDHFTVPEDFWGIDYFNPLENRLIELRHKYKENDQALRILETQQREVDLYKKYSRWYGSAYLVMQKRSKKDAITRPFDAQRTCLLDGGQNEV